MTISPQQRIRLIRMEDPYTDLSQGDEGSYMGTDDAGHVLVKWDSGSDLSLIPEIDEYEFIEESKMIHLKRYESFGN